MRRGDKRKSPTLAASGSGNVDSRAGKDDKATIAQSAVILKFPLSADARFFRLFPDRYFRVRRVFKNELSNIGVPIYADFVAITRGGLKWRFPSPSEFPPSVIFDDATVAGVLVLFRNAGIEDFDRARFLAAARGYEAEERDYCDFVDEERAARPGAQILKFPRARSLPQPRRREGASRMT